MANWYVSGSGSAGGDGSSGSPWRQPSQAVSSGSVGPGDTIFLRNGSYDPFDITKANTTWKKDTGHVPVIDGGWGANKYTSGSGANKVLSSPPTQKVGIRLLAANVVVDGLIIQNTTDHGVTFGSGSQGSVLRNCVTYHTYESGINSNVTSGPGTYNITIENNIVVRASTKIFDPLRGGDTPQNVVGAIKVGNAEGGVIIRNNYIAFCHGEGINFGKFNTDNHGVNIIEGNTVHDVNHTHLYLNRSNNVIVRYNTVYTTDMLAFHKGGPSCPAGLSITDENTFTTTGKNVQMYNNLSVSHNPGLKFAALHQDPPQLKNIYIGYNTIVAVNNSANVSYKAGKKQGNNMIWIRLSPSCTGLIENNVFYRWESEIDDVNSSFPSTVKLRSNNYRVTPDARLRAPGDRYGDPNLRNPRRVIRVTGAYPDKVQNWTDVNFSTDFNIADYDLTSTSGQVINNAGAPTNPGVDVTIPNEPRQKDIRKRNRDAQPDIGAYEYGGSAPPPGDPTVTAVLVLDNTSILQGGTVNGDASGSTATNTTITGYSWNWGDGSTSTGVTAAHTYGSEGTYTVTLTVNTAAGISDSKTATVSVTAVVSDPGTGKALFVAKRVALSTSTGLQTITAPELGTLVPKGALITVTSATTDGTAANGALLSVGGAGGSGGQWVHSRFAENGAATSNTARRWKNDALILSIDGDGAVTGEAQFQDWTAGGIVINITDAFPAAYQAHILFIAGDDTAVWAGSVTGDPVNGTKTVATGFAQDVVIGVSVWAPLNTATADADMGIGLATATDQYCISTEDRDAQADSFLRVRHRAALGVTVDGPDPFATVNAINFGGTGFTLETKSGNLANMYISLLAIKTGTRAHVETAVLGTGGSSAHNLPFKPQAVVGVLSSAVTPLSAENGAPAELLGVYIADEHGPNQFAATTASDSDVATTATRSLSEDRFEGVKPDGASLFDGTGAFGASSFTITWSAAPASAYLWLMLAVEEGEEVEEPPDPEVIPPVASFSADINTGVVPFIIQFDSSLSNENGGGALSYLWDFGDGTTSTQANPTKVYDRAGNYTITLSVANANGQASLTKNGYITAEEEVYAEYLVGPILATDINEYSSSDMLLSEPEGDDTEWDGSHSHGDAFRYLRLREMTAEEIANLAEESPDESRAIVCWDVENHRITVIETDGSMVHIS